MSVIYGNRTKNFSVSGNLLGESDKGGIFFYIIIFIVKIMGKKGIKKHLIKHLFEMWKTYGSEKGDGILEKLY